MSGHEGQYPNGVWPQSHSPGNGYHRHITFNDNAMVRLLEFVREVARGEGYAFVEDARRKKAALAFDQGIGCILKCQIKVDDKLTAWCAQHDEIDFRPWPRKLLEVEYPAWRKRVAAKTDRQAATRPGGLKRRTGGSY